MIISKHTKKRFFKRFVLGTLGFFVVLMLIALIFEGIIGRRVLAEINRNLTTELKAKEVSLSLIRSFPSVALDLQNVLLQGADNKPMFKAAQLRFKFNLFSLFSQNIDIEAVVIENGALLLKVNKNGKANYDIVKASETPSKGDVAFRLEKATIKDLAIAYENIPDAQNFDFTISNAAFKGAFSSKNFDLKSNADIQAHSITVGGNTFLTNNEISYTTAIKVDLDKKLYQIKTFELSIEKNIFDVAGTIQKNKKTTQFDLTFEGKKGNLASLLQLLPEKQRTYLSDFQSDGNISTQATIKGLLSATQNPTINGTIAINNGVLKSSKLADAFENISFNATFSNGANRNAASSTFLIPDFKGSFGNQIINAHLGVKNLDIPYIDFFLDGKLPVKSIYGLLQDKSSDGSGFLTLQDLKVQGFLDDMKKTSGIEKVQMSGKIAADNLNITLKQGQIAIPKGDVEFDNNKISIKNLDIQGLENSALINGNVSNFLPFLLSDSLQKNTKLNFDAKLYAKKLDLNKLIPPTNSEEKTATKPKNKTQKPQEAFYKYLEGNFQANIENFDYQRISGKNFVGNINFGDHDINLSGNVETMGGNMQLKGRLATLNATDLHAIIICNKIDATTFLYQCENFGQKIVTNNNLKGALNAKIVLDAQWDTQGNFLDKKLVTFAYLNIQNGEMKDVKMLEDFSTFVKIQDLKHIKFTTLENWFEIRNGWIFMPAMTIRNNALNMMVSGAQSFENDINYNIKVNAAQVVINRFKAFNPRLSPQKDIEDEGLFDLFFNMKGTLDKYEIEQAKTYVKAEFERSQAQKRDIQTKLNAAVAGKDFQLQEKMLFKTDKIPTPSAQKNEDKDKNKSKPFVLPKNYKPKKQTHDEIGNELLEGF
jgi:AsmA-like C-terminal region